MKARTAIQQSMIMAVILNMSIAFGQSNTSSWSPEVYGLTEDTGLTEVVVNQTQCRFENQVYVYGDMNNHLISKCDGAAIGWVERRVNGAELNPYYDLDMVGKYDDQKFFGATDFKIITPRKGQNLGVGTQAGYINIATCAYGREDIPLEDRPKLSKDGRANYELLHRLMREEKDFLIELYYNDWVMSGKCIGKITELN